MNQRQTAIKKTNCDKIVTNAKANGFKSASVYTDYAKQLSKPFAMKTAVSWSNGKTAYAYHLNKNCSHLSEKTRVSGTFENCPKYDPCDFCSLFK